MGKWWTVSLTISALAAAGLAAFILVPVQRTPPAGGLPADWQPEPGAGEYAMRAGDCLACHTADGGQPFAGGRPIHSALGTIYSANITPDAATGIGGWTLDQFRAALIDGIRADGTHLYPAMPYENYRILTEADIRALYGYFRDEVTAVSYSVPEADLPFPFNQRWGIRALNWLTLRHQAGFVPMMGDPQLDRGQYLVEAPGHCAACHSPRTIYMGQDGLKADEERFLSGGAIEGWEAPPLRGAGSVLRSWQVDELAGFLATGRNLYSTANGEMALVVEHSLQHLSDADILAMSAFLKALDQNPPGQVVTARRATGSPLPTEAPSADAPSSEPPPSASAPAAVPSSGSPSSVPAPSDQPAAVPPSSVPPSSGPASSGPASSVPPSPDAQRPDAAGDPDQPRIGGALPLALPPEPANDAGAATAQMLTEASPGMPDGARLYLDNCAACHFVTGRGSPMIFPALQGNSLVLSDEITPLVSIILHGATVPGTRLRPMPLVMQGYADRLEDAEIAALASFIRSAWGNEASGVTTEAVTRIRSESQSGAPR